MNIAKQTGATDCGLCNSYANMPDFEDRPSVVFDQQQLRTHMMNYLEKGEISAFPVTKQCRSANRVTKIAVSNEYCYCRLPDDGNKMVYMCQV